MVSAEPEVPAEDAVKLFVTNSLSFVMLMGDRDDVEPTPGMTLEITPLMPKAAREKAKGRKLLGGLASIGPSVDPRFLGQIMTRDLENTIAFGGDYIAKFLPFIEGDEILVAEVGVMRHEQQSRVLKMAMPHKEKATVTLQWFLVTCRKVQRVVL